MFSVALSVRSPCLDVIQHPALWSSDFPQALIWTRDHPICFGGDFSSLSMCYKYILIHHLRKVQFAFSLKIQNSVPTRQVMSPSGRPSRHRLTTTKGFIPQKKFRLLLEP